MGKVRGVHTLSVVEKNWGTKTSFDTLVAEGGSCAGGKKETKAYITQLGVRGETVKKNIDPEKVGWVEELPASREKEQRRIG